MSTFARTRFAPAPTGHLHLGHVVNAIYVWGFGRAHGAKVLLRIEDHDRQRSRALYEQSILDDLDWLGFHPDVYPTAAFRAGACASRQSDRESTYRAAVQPLIDRGLVYGCRCSRRDARAASVREMDATRAGCPGGCRRLDLGLGTDLSWRVATPAGVETFVDRLRGRQTQDPAAEGDLVIRDRVGNWTYPFAVVVDDFDQGIDLVIRGGDLLESTGRQIQLARHLGRPAPPAFAHHGLVMKAPHQKLSKSEGDTGVGALARVGWLAEQVIGEAAHRVGLVASGRRIRAAEVPELFAPTT